MSSFNTGRVLDFTEKWLVCRLWSTLMAAFMTCGVVYALFSYRSLLVAIFSLILLAAMYLCAYMLWLISFEV
jgi:hypothetical protein